MAVMRRLETHYRDLCDIEFTIERGKLWMLQTRVGKRTAAAAFRIATQLIDEELITLDEALSRVSGQQLAQLMFPQFDASAPRERLTAGMAASPGAASGRVVFDSATAVEWAARGEQVLLVRRETNPDDLEGMIASAGHPHVPRRQDVPRRRSRPRDGQDLCVRRGGGGRRPARADRADRLDAHRRGRPALHRRFDRRGVCRGRARRRLTRRALPLRRARRCPGRRR